ncbi:hypothetical protein AB4K20DRAFT_1959954 [Rhizopus microsporus]
MTSKTKKIRSIHLTKDNKMRLQPIVGGHGNGVCMNLFNPVVLIICASLATIGFTAPASPASPGVP